MVTLLLAAAESAADAYGLVGTIGLSCAADRAASVSVSFFDRVRDKKKPPGLEAHTHHDRRSGSKITTKCTLQMMISTRHQSVSSAVQPQPINGQSAPIATVQTVQEPWAVATYLAYGASVTGIARIICTAGSTSLDAYGGRSGTRMPQAEISSSRQAATRLRSGFADRNARGATSVRGVA